jgi:ParB family chromosome partitioning protein
MTALLHKLVIDAFQRMSSVGACLEASVRHVFFNVQAADLKDSLSAKSVAERHEAWKTDIPQDDQVLWDWLTALDDTSRLALLAHCVSYGVNALYEKADRYGGSGISQSGLDRRLGQADRLASAVGLDMVEAGWKPTVDNYLGRVPKRRILEAVREGAGERAAQLIDHLKKGKMAKEAERLLADSGWLPEPLRLTDGDSAAEIASTDGEAGALPEFLASAGGETAPNDAEEPQPQVAAAE